VSNRQMSATPELRFVVDDKPTGISVILAWAARVSVVAAFVFIGATKFNDNPRSEWVRIFEQIGWGQWFRYFTGAVQVAGALLMLTPWTLTIGAFLLACTMVGAAIVDIVVVHAVGYALLPLVLLGIIVATWFAGTYGATSRP
jgi:putative oxidoreductase